MLDSLYVLSRGGHFKEREPYFNPRKIEVKDDRSGDELFDDLIAKLRTK